jgi:hypothetical protein
MTIANGVNDLVYLLSCAGLQRALAEALLMKSLTLALLCSNTPEGMTGKKGVAGLKH